MTGDIDITLDIGPDNVADVLDMVNELGWKVLVDTPETFATKNMVLPCLEPNTSIKIDFIFSVSPYEKQALKRVKCVPIGKAHVYFASVEDLIIHKIIAGRPRDLEDAKNVLIKNKNVEVRYIREWLEQFDEALSQSFLMRFEELWKDSR